MRRRVTPTLINTGGGGSLLLDLYPANGGYSLRKLRDSATNAIRVRRSSDNAEQDIGFVVEDLDTVSLLSFVGSGDGYVVTWYDQSGNNFNFSQTNTAKQTKIVQSGLLFNSILSKPYTDSVSGSLYSILNYPFNKNSELTVFSVTAKSTNTSGDVVFDVASGNNFGSLGTIRLDYSGSLRQGTYNGIVGDFLSSSNPVINTAKLRTDLVTTSLREVFLDSLSVATDLKTGGINWSRTIPITTIFGYNWATLLSTYSWEIIIYSSDQSANRTAIEDNINAYYSIY